MVVDPAQGNVVIVAAAQRGLLLAVVGFVVGFWRELLGR